MSDHTPLPMPDDEALQHSARLLQRLKQEIDEQGGVISFARYMEIVLYEPGLGYYSAGPVKLGAAGDFVTAPEISNLFSRCLAHQCREIMQDMTDAQILEFGAGRGVMAADLMLELETLSCLPQRYLILEASADLKQRQQQTLQQKAPHLLERINWLTKLPKRIDQGIILANEVLDAMPVHRLEMQQDKPVELGVGYAGDRLNYQVMPCSDELVDFLNEQCPGWCPVDGTQTELNLLQGPWLKSLHDCLGQGAVMLIDYGYEHGDYFNPDRRDGTLICHYRHYSHQDPFLYPGLQDISASVNFSTVAIQANQAGFNHLGYTTQANFLIGCGAAELLIPQSPTDEVTHLKQLQEFKTLTLPGEMGERFKVLALGKNWHQALKGFSFKDLSNRL